MPLTEKQLKERDAKRNIGEELLAAIQDVKAGHYGAVHHVETTQAAEARSKTGLSPPKFAELLGGFGKNASRVGTRPPLPLWRGALAVAHCNHKTRRVSRGVQ